MKNKINTKKILKEVGFFVGVFLLAGVISGWIDLTPQKAAAQTVSNKIVTVHEIDQEQFAQLVFDYRNETEWKYKGDKPAVIDFYASWCGPCKRLAPRLEQLAKEYGDAIVVYKIDAEANEFLARAMGVTAFPTLLFVPVEGTPTMGKGLMSLKTLREEVEKIR